jgi:hypothetical protein
MSLIENSTIPELIPFITFFDISSFVKGLISISKTALQGQNTGGFKYIP